MSFELPIKLQSDKFNHAAFMHNTFFQYFLIISQIAFLICFCVMGETDLHRGHSCHNNAPNCTVSQSDYEFHTQYSYGHFQDVHVMIFIGFGFLMTFLKSYSWSAVGFNMLLATYAIQWSIIVQAFFFHDSKIIMNYEAMFEAEFSAGAVLISFGAVLGRLNTVHLLVMCFLEIVFYKLNYWLIVSVLGGDLAGLKDVGGSMVIHAFGAYFGLAVSRVMYKKEREESFQGDSEYYSDLTAMIGTIFLWMYWPSFNSIPATDLLERQVICTNTYLSLAGACITTFALSGFSEKERRLDMVHIQNATLAGGVAIGSTANFIVSPGGALTIGVLAGLLSTVGYQFITDFLANKMKIYDTCGVHNLHGMPGVFAGVVSMIVGNINGIDSGLLKVHEEAGVDASNYAVWVQGVALAVTLGVAIGGGCLTGVVMKVVEKILAIFERRARKGGEFRSYHNTAWLDGNM